MPKWITNERGEWFPAKERVALVNHAKEAIVNPSATWSSFYGQMVGPGEPYIYEGPDRAALFELFQTGEEHLGSDFHNDPDLLQRVRNLGYKDIDEYAKAMGYSEKEAKQRFLKYAAEINKHEIPQRIEAIKKLGGGTDLSGQGRDVYGGFGEPPDK